MTAHRGPEIEAEFVGGPLDGEVIVLPPGTRQWLVPMLTRPDMSVAATLNPSTLVEIRVGVYVLTFERRPGSAYELWWDGER